jgi:putative transposase
MIDYAGCVQLRYSYRLDPSPAQRTALARAFGCARVVFNDGLAARKAAFEAGQGYVPDAELSKRLTGSKKTPERAWLAEVSSVVLQQALADLNAAYRNFFDSVNGKRKGPKAAAPRFRSRKDSRQAVRFTANSRFKVLDNGRLRLPKTGDVTTVIRENQAVYVEDLAVRGLARTRLAKSVHDAGWAAFVSMLEYEARLYGREFRKAGRWEPTSQVCSACGVKDGPKPLHVRGWTCKACGTVHDRDVNAARNIAALGRREARNARGGDVRPALTLAVAGEAGSRRGAA